jgi:outer membrane protein TolC
MRVAGETYRALGEDVLLRIVVAYWELVFADDQVDARLKSESVASELLTDAKSREEAQVGTPLDVAEARAGLERRRGDRIIAENLRGTAEDQLRGLILPFGRGSAPAVRIEPTDDARVAPPTAPEEGQEERYVRLALDTRPEIRASRAELGNRGIDVSLAEDATKPQLDLLARLSTDGLDGDFGGALDDVITAKAASASIGLQFSMFLGRRAARANLRLAQWACRQAVLRHKELENRTVLEVRSALRDVSGARALLAAATAETQAADEDLVGEREKLQQGKSTPFLLLQKEETVTDARTRMNRAVTLLRVAEARLWRSVGMLARTLGVQLPSAGR